MPNPFEGKIELDVRDSVPDWDAFLPDRAPEGAPNVLVVLYDDTGPAAWTPFGGRIEMPTLQRLADNGPDLFAVAHHCTLLADAFDLPYRPESPSERFCANRRRRARVPRLRLSYPARERNDCSRWYPDLVYDNHYVDQPCTPEEGYHLSKDLADKALEFIRDAKQTAPEKPWYLWFCPGANHAPHHADDAYVDVEQQLAAAMARD
jgi:arylsulfatase A-like enzyme